MIEFEVMIRPARTLQALGEATGNRVGPQLIRLKQAAAEPRRAVFDVFQALTALARNGALWQGSARSVEALRADSRIRGMLP
jgi:hypothetical protein